MRGKNMVKETTREGKRLLSTTNSVCPVCLHSLPAERAADDGGVYLEKRCPEHGLFSTLIWEGDEVSYLAWDRGSAGKDDIPQAKPSSLQGCPRGCGICQRHQRKTCCVLLEVTERCNLHCPVCFASSGGEGAAADPSLSQLEARFDRLMEAGGPFNIQLSGGEPTMRDDLPAIIAAGRERGFSFFQLNTNGLRLARQADFPHQLKEAGLDCVFLQFDGVSTRPYERLRGQNLLEEKLTAIDRCAQAGLGVVLVPTIAPGVNEEEIGGILRFALAQMPAVRGVHFQPMSYFGRCPEGGGGYRITIPFMLREIQRQTGGLMQAGDFSGGGAENSYCSFHASYLRDGEGGLKALAAQESDSCCSSDRSREVVARQWSGSCCKRPESFNDGFEEFLYDMQTNTLAVSGMLFQDAWNLDLERLRECYLCESNPRFGLVPFCAYNLSSARGDTLYRGSA